MTNKKSDYDEIVPYITSEDYRARMIGEYKELDMRARKLNTMICKYHANQLDFVPKCPIEILELQYEAMLEYHKLLKARMQIERIAE